MAVSETTELSSLFQQVTWMLTDSSHYLHKPQPLSFLFLLYSSLLAQSEKITGWPAACEWGPLLPHMCRPGLTQSQSTRLRGHATWLSTLPHNPICKTPESSLSKERTQPEKRTKVENVLSRVFSLLSLLGSDALLWVSHVPEPPPTARGFCLPGAGDRSVG